MAVCKLCFVQLNLIPALNHPWPISGDKRKVIHVEEGRGIIIAGEFQAEDDALPAIGDQVQDLRGPVRTAESLAYIERFNLRAIDICPNDIVGWSADF